MKELEELERLANAADAGPWEGREGGGNVHAHVKKIDQDKQGRRRTRFIATFNATELNNEANALFVGVFSPDVILSLIRELKITRRALENASKVQRRSLLLGDEVYEQRDCAQVAYNLRLAERELYPETEQP